MGMMLKFRSRQPKPLQDTSLPTTSPSASSSISSSSQPQSPVTPRSPSLGSYSPASLNTPSADSPTLKAGFDMVSVDARPKAGILLYNSSIPDEGQHLGGGVEWNQTSHESSSQRPASNSSLPSLRFTETSLEGHPSRQRSHTSGNKHVAYATAFDGSIVRRREITTPSSTGSLQGSPKGSPQTRGCELPSNYMNCGSVASSITSSTATTLVPQPQYEYSRIYYSSGNSQKRKGLRGILAR